jgi:hypothetical protein
LPLREVGVADMAGERPAGNYRREPMTARCITLLALATVAVQFLAAAALIGAEAERCQRRLQIENAGAGIVIASLLGPQFHAPRAFHAFEQFENSRVQRLREGYALNEVALGAETEFEKMLALRH